MYQFMLLLMMMTEGFFPLPPLNAAQLLQKLLLHEKPDRDRQMHANTWEQMMTTILIIMMMMVGGDDDREEHDHLHFQ